ncbi:MAG: SRPBCC family protein [Candidatus Gygaella obscura]|nr:SRPBCC family protein [Candidatus Gygaella obscura]
MHSVELKVKVRSLKNKIFDMLKDIERFPEYMRFVKNVKIINASENRVTSLWNLEIDGAPVSWRQEDFIDNNNFEVRFKMLEGDYQHYEGRIYIEDLDEHHCVVKIVAHFDWGIPVLEEYVKKVLERKARLALGGMLKALKRKLETENV